MKRIVLVGALFFAVSIFLSVHAQTPTKLGVPNAPPRLIQNFSDIFIVVNDSLLDYLDLDDYFTDDNGDTLNFTYSTITNITITIDSNNSVSFIPDAGYIGTQNLVFYAADNSTNASSNNFTITVGIDTEAPKWTNPAKSKDQIFQNQNVNFSTSWTDNLALSYFVFSINEGSWVDYAAVNFSGTANTSIQKAQISASEGKIVYWRFSATDESGNTNTTDVQNFTVQEVKSSGGGSGGSTVTGQVSGVEQQVVQQGSDSPSFEVEPINMRVTLRQGDTLTRVVKIRNIGNRELVFSSVLEGITDLAVIDADSFSIPSSGSQELLVDFTIPDDATPDQYFGQLIIKSTRTVVVPIVVDVKVFDAAIDLSVNVTEDTRFVRTGEQVRAVISIQNLKDVREAPADLFYAIKDFEGNILESATEEITLFASFEEARSLTVPPGDYQGEHIFYARVLSNDLVDLGSDTFYIGSRFRLLFWLDKLLYPLLILLLLLIIFLLIWVRERNRKKKKLLELYLLLNELRILVDKGKMDAALSIYKKIKVTYGQHVSKGFIKDKEKLRVELEKFSKVLQKVKKTPPKEKPTEKSVGKGEEQTKKEGDAQGTKEDKEETVTEEKSVDAKKEQPATKEKIEETKGNSVKEEQTKKVVSKEQPTPEKKPAAKVVADKKSLPAKKPVPKAEKVVTNKKPLPEKAPVKKVVPKADKVVPDKKPLPEKMSEKTVVDNIDVVKVGDNADGK